MYSKNAFSLVLLRPEREFGSLSEAVALAGATHLKLAAKLFHLPQVAVILDRNGEPAWVPSLFLADRGLRGRSVTGDTVRTYAEALIAWFNFLHARSEPLNDVTEESLGAYRAYLMHGMSAQGRRFSTATANNRVAVAAQFHLWGQQSATQETALGAHLLEWERLRRSESRLTDPHGRYRKTSASVVIRRLPTALSRDEISRLFVVAPMPYRLIFKWALTTGLRRFEICGLQLAQLPTPEQVAQCSDGLIRIEFTRKGFRTTTVHVPIGLIEETNWYVLTERPPPQRDSEQFVFLNRRRHAISRGSLTTAFRACADLIGSSATLHHLRHTFAVHVLGVLDLRENNGDPMNSLKTLQILLGHASVETTEIYLQAVETSSASVVEALDYLYGATL